MAEEGAKRLFPSSPEISLPAEPVFSLVAYLTVTTYN